MSISFNDPMNKQAADMISKFYGQDLVAMDEKSALFNSTQVSGGFMSALANTSGQVATVDLNGQGDIKTMSDGTKYEVTRKGWKKIAG